MLYQMWITKRSALATQASAKQTKAEQDELLKSVIAAHVDSGARLLMRCESGWANEQQPYWGITTFPDLDSRMKQHQLLNRLASFQNAEPSFTLLGTALEEPRLENIQPGMVYSLWMVRNEPAAYIAYNALASEDKQQLWEKVSKSIDRVGGCWILRCDCYWANDAYRSFGVEVFPSLEALQAYKKELLSLNWPTYIPGTNILGTLDFGPEQVKQLLGEV